MPDGTHVIDTAPARPLRRSLLRGWRRRCPSCGNGHMMKGYLKVAPVCPVCREELFHHSADDGPAYLTILIVGHLMAPLLHLAFVEQANAGAVLHTHSQAGTLLSQHYGPQTNEIGGLKLHDLEMLKGLDGIHTHACSVTLPATE